MEITADLASGVVALRDGANFRAFNVAAALSDSDAAVGALLAQHHAGGPCTDADHVWVAKTWLVKTAAASPGGAPGDVNADDWHAGFAKMLALAEKMGWLDAEHTHIKAHIERR